MRGWRYCDDDRFEDVYFRRLLIVYLGMNAVILIPVGLMMLVDWLM